MKGSNPYDWLHKLQGLQADNTAVKLTIADIMERASDLQYQGKNLEPSSPRSVLACLRLGIEPCELRAVPLAQFCKNISELDLAALCYEHHEAARQAAQLRALLEERKRIVEEGEGSPSVRKSLAEVKVNGFDTGDMVEKEAKRLEVQRRRQERNLEQMVNYELMRKTLQEKAEAKLAKVEARAEAERRSKAAANAEYRRHQHERELQLLQAEGEQQQKIKAAEGARYKQEMRLAARQAEEEKVRQREAAAKDAAAKEKTERARKETERILAQQQAEIEHKKKAMDEKSEQREAVKGAQQAEAARKHEEVRAKADARIAAALQSNATILEQRRSAFDKKEAGAEQRRREKEAQRKAEEKEAAAKEAAKQAQRKQAYQDAQQREADRVAAILKKQRAKEAALSELAAKRDHEADIKALHRQLDLEDKRAKVEVMWRRDVFRRAQMLNKIEEGRSKAEGLLSAKSELQVQRRIANLEASMQRQRLQEAVEKLQSNKNWAASPVSLDLVSVLSSMKK